MIENSGKKIVCFISCFLLTLLFFQFLPTTAHCTIPSPLLQPGNSSTNNILQLHNSGHVLGFGTDRVYFAGMGYALIEEFVGAAGTSSPVPGRHNTSPSVEQVSYPNLWQGITLVYSLSADGLAESTYTIAPHADPEQIRLSYNISLEIQKDGSLRFSHPDGRGWFSQTAPIAWQIIGEQKVPVEVAFTRQQDNTIGFQTGEYDPDYAVRIDPVYQWHTFYGSSGRDYGTSIAVAQDGSIFIAGTSQYSWSGNSETPPLHPHSKGYDFTVLKLDAGGNYVWHTFYGSSLEDHANAITVDENGDLFITGESKRTWQGTDNTSPLHAYTSGGYNITILKLDTDGRYLWHSFYGSADWDFAYSTAVDSNGNVLVTGTSTSAWPGDASSNPIHNHSGANDIFILKLDTDGVYQWHTFYGVNDGYSDQDSGNSITADSSNNIYIAGDSEGSWQGEDDQPPIHPHSGGYDITVLKLDQDGTYLWHTFYGSTNGYNEGYSIAVDTDNSVLLAGDSDESWQGEVDTPPLHAHSGGYDFTVLKLDAEGGYLWHTFYGSNAWDFANSIALDGGSNLFVAGSSYADWLGGNESPPEHAYGGNGDLTLLKLNSSGEYLEHSFYGAAYRDQGNAVATDPTGYVLLAGSSAGSWLGDDAAGPVHPYTTGDDITVLKLSAGCPTDPGKTEPGICGCGVSDTDSDNDGTPDCNDTCSADPDKILAGVCGCGVPDTDSDNDGTADCLDTCSNDPYKIAPGTCGCGIPDTDFDNDGVLNCFDSCPADPDKTEPGICGCGTAETDSNNDGTPECIDYCPGDPEKMAPGICGCGVADTDTDNDGFPNCIDYCSTDPYKTTTGICGCNAADIDSDNDGLSDCIDYCPRDPEKTMPGTCGCSIVDTDSDNDGFADCIDYCSADINKTEPGICGCGTADTDTDSDGIPDCNDSCPEDSNKTEQGVCGCGIADTDTDGDGTPDCIDTCSNDPEKTESGICGCGVSDIDTDSDGTPDCNDICPDDFEKTEQGICGCGVADTDTDNDGTPDCNDACANDSGKLESGICGCGTPDTDSDHDGTMDCMDGCPEDPDKIKTGVCGCGIADTDADNNGIPDCNDTEPPPETSDIGFTPISDREEPGSTPLQHIYQLLLRRQP